MANGQPSQTGDGGTPLVLPAPRVPAAPADVLERMPAALYLLDGRWRITYANAAAERLVRRPRSSLLGREVWTLFSCAVGAEVRSSLRRAVAEDRPVAFEVPHRRTDGEDAWYEVQAWPGEGSLAVHVADVTDRRRAQVAAQRAGARSALLARLPAELSGARDGEAALGALARLVVPTLADACIVTVVDRDGRARDVGSWHADPQRRELLEHYADVRLETLPPTSPVARALATGTPVTDAVPSVLALMPPGQAADLLRELRPATAVVLPLPAAERTVGVLTLYLDEGRTPDETDLATAREVAAQAGRAVERVHRQSQQAQLAEALQRSLLTAPPDLPDAQVVVRYVPAAEAARVGGDWYDAFLLRDGTPVLVIGDVTGHDTAAAAAMGQLRGLLRGVAHAGGGGPAEVLRAFDEAVVAMHPGTLATAAVAFLARTPDGGTRLRWASAGHPPPAVLDVQGRVVSLGGSTGDLLLGVDPTAPRGERTVDLHAGDTVLLYTDGLVERRDSTIDAGTARLVAGLEELAGQPLERLCDALLDRVLHGVPQDDVALVAVRVRGRAG